jgi:phospholipid/cholesterol/gamma-HCH transport system substrate-binding protein
VIINILPGIGDRREVQPGDVIISNKRLRTDDMLNTLNTTNQNAAILTSDLLAITNDINNGKGTIGILLRDTAMANDVKQTIHNLKIASHKATQTIESLNSQMAALDN